MKYNIVQRNNIFILLMTIFCLGISRTHAQELTISKYGLKVVSSIDLYKEIAKKDNLRKMVSLQKWVPGIVLDLRYAGTNNFMKQNLYPTSINYTFMRQPAAKALALVQNELNAMGYGLKIFDAYRPYSVTEKFWELVHDDRYVADPKKGSGHNRGIAVDLTIIDLKTNRELEMPTGFDNFTDSAHHDFMNLSLVVLKNRKLLKETMEKFGFMEFPTEWWHYSLPEPERFEVLDISFEDLKKLN